jgi:hypothetical protein
MALLRNWQLAAIALAGSLVPAAASAQTCTGGTHVTGIVVDPNGAAIANAQVQAADGAHTVSDDSGRFAFPCLPAAAATLTVQAPGFAAATVPLKADARGTAHLNVALVIANVETTVQVGNDDNGLDSENGAGSHTLTGKDIQQLADDPDDFKRQLQVLAATSGGAPGQARITVDGFQNTSALPPKSSIAAIRINPDMFSAEYQEPPYDGGHIEIITKPGSDSWHGALFYTDSDGSFNATDPFSVVATPAGKRRYGFEFSGPIQKQKSDFSLALEKRDIDEFNVVNAITLDANDDQTTLNQTVAAPQRLWIASARGDWQLTQKDTVALSFSANVSNLGNQGVGGLTLAEDGYDSHVSEYDLRLTNTQTLSANLLHETHIGYTWNDSAQTPLSTTPNLEVAGYFTGGGATGQNLNDRERDLEIDDDVLYTHGKQSWKIGAQAIGAYVHDYDPDTFNGAFVFGGGSAPALDANGNPTGQTTTVDGLEQYRRAKLNLPGGTPTTYQYITGTPLVPFTQWKLALYGEDTVKLAPRLSVAAGFRYAMQTSPGSFANFDPRVGISWAPDKKEKWVLHLRAGLFNGTFDAAQTVNAYRLNGTRQTEYQVYSPNFSDPRTPTADSVQVSTVQQFAGNIHQVPIFQAQVGAEHDFPHHWHAQVNLFYASVWGDYRLRNINAPLVTASTGTSPNPLAALEAPRPGPANENIFSYENTGHLNGTVLFSGLDQHSYKRFGFFLGYLHFDLTSDAGNGGGGIASPQSSYSNAGESSRPTFQATNRIFFFGNLNLPWKVSLSPQFDASSGAPYNVTTGVDANGDGDFNDRPSYASAPGTGVYSTRFGLLTTNTTNGNVPRNLGTMPALIHLDMNLSRAFKLGGKETNRTLTLNARAANLLNHTNVTAVGTTVSSPTFSQSLSAEAARRVELGARFSF